MIRADAVIVGGGPGGSTCARVLRNAGWNVVLLERARYPRDKVCAGWLTPEVFRLLELSPDEYRSTGMTLQEITGFRTSVIGGAPVVTRYPEVVSYAIRRCEFDEYLVRRAAVNVLEGTPLESLRRDGDRWIVNDHFDTAVVVGAGGHFCPVARMMKRDTEVAPVIAKEAEFPIGSAETGARGELPELFFCRDLEGYGWCVRKGEYLNVGLGRRDKHDFSRHLEQFVAFLQSQRLMPPSAEVRWRGHAYLAAGTGPRPTVFDGMMLVGDAAGLAYPESGEGIRPAIESGRLAAETLIAARRVYSREALEPYARALCRLYPAARPTPAPVRAMSVRLGRALMRSRAFTRYVVLDRWFLRRSSARQPV